MASAQPPSPSSSSSHETTAVAVIIDDEESLLILLGSLLRKVGFQVHSYYSSVEALRHFDEIAPRTDVVFTDRHLPGVDGLGVLHRLRESWPDIPVVIMTGDTNAKAAVEAMRLGAYDYLIKPLDRAEGVVLVAKRAAERRRLVARNQVLERALRVDQRFEELVSSAPSMEHVFDTIDAAAPTDATVLLLGESGTGKELVARAIHRRSSRRSGPFLPVNCSALTETLLESELFGHVRGGFSGATSNHTGLFEQAADGTLFLDEIGDITPRVQVSLLRALQEGEIRPVGSSLVRKVNTRVVAATNRDLLKAVREKSFREDLYYRLNVIAIDLPPLRKRPEDIVILTQFFLERYAQRFSKPARRVSPAVIEHLQAYTWPGNVRELENAIQRMVVLSRSEEMGLRELPAEVRNVNVGVPFATQGGHAASELSYVDAKKEAVNRFEREFVTNTLIRARGNLAEAARLAGVDQSNLRRIARRQGLNVGEYREEGPGDREHERGPGGDDIGDDKDLPAPAPHRLAE